ncbi:VWA domain-containing protein [Methylomonas rosea]|uniref:VWA domain-containing protein n=1 Tax=Methylomonas rosea TaxID=2952227 RepID=A0ABT1TS66_9GAMM|nr:vWA domain-containing protein [Methylomonas sp. WSC-7]MCQ8117196.1 VWA domain-containing protein [Methylomonas sp. WSC-7]
MFKSFIYTVFCALLLSVDSAHCQPAPAAAGADEIQVLIDVSGSMKQNDPDNLRIEASRLLVNLLPDGAKAAFWLFAEKTTPLSAADTVNSAWKQQASKATANIHSRGLYTHIEDAIQTVLSQGFSGSGKKHLILLTDGFVDISKDIMQSADSRERILSEWIPKLQQQNINVQTIALSEQADKELLEKLAFETGGWAETAQSAEQLQRVFLKMAQKAAPKETLPLTDNKFKVDSGIHEFSVLVFKKPHAAPTQLVAPDGKSMSKQSMVANVSWLESQAYDLITVKQPLIGEWRLVAEVDPDNQVMIVTDLKLQLSEIPNFLGESETLPIKAHFTDKDKLIARADFLGMLTLEVIQDQQAPAKMHALVAEPGFYQHQVEHLSLGKHLLKIVADGKTFKREIIHEIEVVATPITVEKHVDAAQRQISLKLLPDTKLIDPAGLVINAVINQAGHEPETRALASKDGVWLLDLVGLPPETTTHVNFNVMAKDHEGKPLTPAVTPLSIDDSWFAPAEKAEVAAPVAATDAHHESADHEEANHEAGAEHHEQSDQEQHPPPDAPKTNWLLVGGILLAINLVLGVGGFFTYRYLKKSQAEKHQQLLERLS